MVGIVKEIDGQKKIVPLTTDTGTGAPVGTLVSQYKKVPMSGYLYCDGSTFDENDYPALYMYLGTNVLPDYRECVMVGAEQNTTDTIATHDVYGEGEFKDDQYQFHTHYIADSLFRNRVGFEQSSGSNAGIANAQVSGELNGGRAWIADKGKYDSKSRPGETTHGKQKAVYVYIKATSGLAENQQENVLNDVKGYVDNSNSYSTDEVKTGGKWIDGKPIYRKVVDFGALPNATIKEVSFNNINADTFVKIEGIAMNNSGSAVTIPFADTSAATQSIAIFINSSSVSINTGATNRSDYTKCYITIEYTKTTD